MAISPYPFIIFMDFVITFVLFPGPTFSKTFVRIDSTWAVIIFNLCYNVGDTIGKFSAELKGAFNRLSLFFMFFSRLFFFFPITFMATGADQGDPMTDNEVFPFVVQFLFAFTNGFCLSKLPLTQTPPSSRPSRCAL